LSVVESEKQLESKYMEFIGSFKESGKQLSSSVVENYLLKLEVTYLRRKIELKDRRDSSEDSLIRIED
jgi:regulator of replication initiation timing